MELIFKPCGEFWWSPEGPVSQIHSHLLFGATGIFSALLRSVQMLKREWCVESNGSYRTYLSLVKLQPWFLSLRWKACLWAELQPWCLSVQWKTYPWAEHSCDIYINTVIQYYIQVSIIKLELNNYTIINHVSDRNTSHLMNLFRVHISWRMSKRLNART